MNNWEANFGDLLRLALAEDLEPLGDITTNIIIPENLTARLFVQSRKQSGIMSGSFFIKKLCEFYDKEISINFSFKDGENFPQETKLIEISGNARSLLTIERLLLNLLQRAISIATYTGEFIKKIKHTKCKILETRKTSPGLRMLEKRAVLDGGASNHRYNLSTGILIKDNHIALAGSIEKAIELAIKNSPYLTKIEVEVDSLEQLKQALNFKIDVILLDNFSIENIYTAIKLISNKCIIEVSGGINMQNIKEIAETGVDYISLGCLTQSPPQIDIGLDFI